VPIGGVSKIDIFHYNFVNSEYQIFACVNVFFVLQLYFDIIIIIIYLFVFISF